MPVYQLYTEKNGERFSENAHRLGENAHRLGENAQRFSAATAVLLVCAAVSHAGVAVLLVAGAGGGSVKAK